MTNSIYKQLQQEAIRIARRYPDPGFYTDFSEQVARSKRFFAGDEVVCRLWRFVAENIENDYGHGLEHVRNVAVDAGALVLIETGSDSAGEKQLEHRMRLAHAAGLLHDIRRKEKNHAAAGARYARQVLKDCPFSGSDIDEICLAIGNHEAFGENLGGETRASSVLSDSLYDADKFRWGPENFTGTLWAMVSYRNVSLERFIRHYPGGMAYLKKIRGTFRTPTGRLYGPQFIDLGIAIGEELYDVICKKYAGRPGS
ncbi:MAG: HD domain-containing protein [Desulfosalsimonas sp.]